MANTNPRQFHTQQVHYLRKTVNFNDAGISSGVVMGTVPAGSLIVDEVINIETAFNAGTTNVLTVGYDNDSGYDNIVAAGDVTEGSAAVTRVTTGCALAPTTAVRDVLVKYAQTGDAATAGKAHIVIAFVPNNDA